MRHDHPQKSQTLRWLDRLIADLSTPLAALAIGVAVLATTTFEPPRGGV